MFLDRMAPAHSYRGGCAGQGRAAVRSARVCKVRRSRQTLCSWQVMVVRRCGALWAAAAGMSKHASCPGGTRVEGSARGSTCTRAGHAEPNVPCMQQASEQAWLSPFAKSARCACARGHIHASRCLSSPPRPPTHHGEPACAGRQAAAGRGGAYVAHAAWHVGEVSSRRMWRPALPNRAVQHAANGTTHRA